MRKVILSLLCLLLGAGVCAAKKKDRKADQLTTSREITVPDSSCTELEVMDMIHVFLEEGRDPSRIRIETEGISAEEVLAKTESGVLTLCCSQKGRKEIRQGNYRKRRPRSIRVYVGTGALNRFACSGMASISTEATIDRPVVGIDLSGMADVEMNLSCDRLQMTLSGMADFDGRVECRDEARFDVSGMSDCRLTGRAAKLDLQVSGMSDYKGGAFEVSDYARCMVSGMSDAKVNCTGEVDLQVGGMSDFVLQGGAEIRSISVEKSSSVKIHRKK